MNEQPAEANKLVEPEPCESVKRELEPEPRRSTRQTTQPDRYDIWVDTVAAEPATVQEALTGPEKEEWINAMKQKMKSIIYSNVWDLVELPQGKQPIGGKWVFKKKHADGSMDCFKAHLVAQGFTDKMFSPVLVSALWGPVRTSTLMHGQSSGGSGSYVLLHQ